MGTAVIAGPLIDQESRCGRSGFLTCVKEDLRWNDKVGRNDGHRASCGSHARGVRRCSGGDAPRIGERLVDGRSSIQRPATALWLCVADVWSWGHVARNPCKVVD